MSLFIAIGCNHCSIYRGVLCGSAFQYSWMDALLRFLSMPPPTGLPLKIFAI
jgi:hypothetical protein